jgi:hypothetical protein
MLRRLQAIQINSQRSAGYKDLAVSYLESWQQYTQLVFQL